MRLPGTLRSNVPVASDPIRLVLFVGGTAKGAEGVGRRLARDLSASPRVADLSLEVLRSADGSVRDPWRLRDRLRGTERGGAVLVAPRRWGPRRLVPAPAVHGRPVTIVQADDPDELPSARPGPDASAPWVVAAMAKDVFLRPTDSWAPILASEGRKVRDLRADRARRSDLIRALRAGPPVVLYAGHGRTRGWGGYQALRGDDLAAWPGTPKGRPVGVVLAFACDTLKRSRSRVPFGSRLVRSGRARAYVGAVGSIGTRDASELAELVVRLLAEEDHPTLLHLIRAVDRAVEDRPRPARAWRSFRCLGDLTTPLSCSA